MEVYRVEGRGQLLGSFEIEIFFEGDFTLELAASGREPLAGFVLPGCGVLSACTRQQERTQEPCSVA